MDEMSLVDFRAELLDKLERPFKGRGLTAKQEEVANLMARGYTIKEVAQRLGISSQAVAYRLDGVNSKLNTTTRELPLRLYSLLRAYLE